ncbi:EAL domain-containing protein [Sulfurimonas sp.]
MKSIKKFYLFIILIALIFFIVNEFITYKISLTEEIQSTYKHDKQILKNLFTAQKRYLSSLSLLLASDSVIIDAYKQNNPKLIISHVTPMWQKLKKDKLIHEIHFFKPPALYFVNFSNFKSIGTDVSKVRTDIVWVTSSFQESSHIFMCKSYAGYRSTTPILDSNGKILGGLSLGEKVDWLPKILKQRTTHDSFLLYNLNATKTLAPKYYKEFMQNKERIGNLILGNKTIDISAHAIKNIDINKKIQKILINGENYILYLYPLIDFNRNNMGYICAVTQLESFKHQFMVETIKNIFLIFLTVLLLLYINRKNNLKISAYITKIKEITNKLKNRDFTFLHTKPLKFYCTEDETLEEIEKNIFDMGLSMEQQYSLLEQDNREKDKQLIKQLSTDILTGLKNRNALLQDLKTYDKAFLIIYNLRGFKNINDAFGFKVGNMILNEVAQIATNHFAQSFFIYRISSDEFIAINHKQLSESEFLNLTKELINKIESRVFHASDIEINLNLYSGICLGNSTNRLASANLALRHAKDNGLSSYIYQPNDLTQQKQIENINMLHKISNALSSDNIVSFFQPIVDREQKIIKYESLVRLIDNEKVLSPYYFLDIAKKTTLYTEITKVVLQKTFATFKNSDKVYSINLTALDILNDEVRTLVYEKLDTCKNASQVTFELVESDDLYEIKEVEIFLQTIKEKGAKIAIDDFGTGYSNFSYIIKLKPDCLKIDGSLIKNIDKDDSSYKSVQTIITFAHELNISVVAEFISSKEIFDICYKLGVDEFQGYYFSEPKSSI